MNTDPGTVGKVTAFVTRRGPGGDRELLLFEHDSAGIQLPAGTVERGESFDAAVMREAREETGLDARLVGPLCEPERTDLTDEARMFAATSALRTGPGLMSEPLIRLRRGQWCAVTARAGDSAEVLIEERNLNLPSAPIMQRFSGWVASSALAEAVERRYYLLHAPEMTAETWIQEDEGHRFRCFWVPLTTRTALVAPQQLWLDRVWSSLTGG